MVIRLTPTAVCGLLIILTLVAFAGVLRNGFTTYDDQTYVSANRHIQNGLSVETVRWAFTTTRAANWHPLTWLSHTLDWSLYGANPLGHHLTSLILHVANTLLYRMTGAWRPAGFAAALFAVHPLHVESVAWIAERKDVLSAAFWLLATWLYVDYAKAPSKGRLALVTLSMALGLLAKPMLVTLPFTFSMSPEAAVAFLVAITVGVNYGNSIPAMAKELYLAPSTVKTHVQRLYEKLGVGDRGAAVAEAMRRKLLE